VIRAEGRPPRKRGSDRHVRGTRGEQVCVLAATDTSGAVILQVAGRGRMTKGDANRILMHRFRRKSANPDTLVTDSERIFSDVVREKNLLHEEIQRGGHLSPNGFGIQRTNSLHARLDKWMPRFNGVASKYLQNYMNYFVILEKSKGIHERFLQIWIWAFSNKKAFRPYGKNLQHLWKT